MPNFCMTLSYDGTRYNGWQRQGNTPDTVQGRLETALSALLGQPVEVAGSGRTDAGVHARMQTASFRAKTDLPAPELLLDSLTPADITRDSALYPYLDDNDLQRVLEDERVSCRERYLSGERAAELWDATVAAMEATVAQWMADAGGFTVRCERAEGA